MQHRISESPLSKTKSRSQNGQMAAMKAHTVHNQDKLRVLIKFKPSSRQEQDQQVRYINQNEIEIKTALKNKLYRFDHVFSGRQSWREVFEIGCKDIIDNVFMETQEQHATNHGLLFVYGNTGTGKTYSMGLLDCIRQSSNGIVPDSIRYIFSLKKKKPFEHYAVSISFGQVYMDQVYDLLDLQNDTKLAVRQDTKTKQHYVENQMIIEVRSPEQAFQILNIGLDKRKIAEQKMNRRSSRGHGLITISLDPCNGHKAGRLCFIDLAGCERLKDSQSKGTTLSQALHINSSLSSLQTLLMNVSQQGMRNYRSSKLTRLLQPYIEHGKINLFVTSTAESVNAVEFAKRCKGIKFMERDLRQSTNPIKRSHIIEKNTNKTSKELEELVFFKRQALEREKKLNLTVEALITAINQICREMESCLQMQKFPFKFSFSEIINNAQLQSKINAKIQTQQTKEQKLVQDLLYKLQQNQTLQQMSWNYTDKIQQLTELSNLHSDRSTELCETIRGIGVLLGYRNVYKKELFMSELKLQLLQQRCKKFQDGLIYLVKFMNTADKRVGRKLKELNINALQNIQNHSSVRNRNYQKQEKHASKSVLQQNNMNTRRDQSYSPKTHRLSSLLVISQRRGAIFIDEL